MISQDSHGHLNRQMTFWWHINARVVSTRVVIIKFKPKRKNQMSELTKWSDHQSNWVTPSLSKNLRKFIGSFFGNLFISREVSLEKTLPMSHGTLTIIRCPFDNISTLQHWSANLDVRRYIRRSDWWIDWTTRASEWRPHCHRSNKNL